jgi:type IV pilus assembly protein PilY1
MTARTTAAGSTRAVAALALAMALLRAGPAAGQPIQEAKPVILLLLDTSGSMEYSVAASPDEAGNNDSGGTGSDTLLLPTCDDVTLTYGVSRFGFAQQVLTGTFVGYTCSYDDRTSPGSREDHDYRIPHVKAHYTAQTAGLIDVTEDRFKFGVMTFDVNPSDDTGKNGGFSYGPETGINYGAKNTAPQAKGRFVKPEETDGVSKVRQRNGRVQDSILEAIPYGGTPIAPMLHDALYFFQTEPSQQAWDPVAGTGDPLLACRSRSIVLLSDGRSNLGESRDGYLSSIAYADLLRSRGVLVYVVGFQLPAGVDTQMNAIAAAGGTHEAYIVSDPANLIVVLSLILGNVETGILTKTRTVVTDDTQDAGTSRDLQYQFNAGYGMIPDVPGQRRGFLEQSVFRCMNEASVAQVFEVNELADELVTLGEERTIYTLIDGALEEFDAGQGSAVTADVLEVPTTGPYVDFGRTHDGLCGTDFLSGENARDAYAQNVVDYIRARHDSCRRGYPLGAIVHSTPAIQGHLANIDLAVDSFARYKHDVLERNGHAFRIACPRGFDTCNPLPRPTMLYVGSADGILHAFRVDRGGTGIDFDQELWGYVPRHLLAELQTLPTQFRPLLDGSPVVKDILMRRTVQTTGLPNFTQEVDQWKSVLVVGDREGGRGYTALDVTDPEHPQLLWEIGNRRAWNATLGTWEWKTERCLPEPTGCLTPDADGLTDEEKKLNDFSRLGWTWSQPALGNIYLDHGDNDREEIAVAVFGGGKSDGLTEDGVGRSVFVVRLSDGAKLAEFSKHPTFLDRVTDECSVSEDDAIDADMISGVTCYSTFPGTFITRCFIGDTKGQLWRLDLGSRFTDAWKLEFFFDAYKHAGVPLDSVVRAPVYEAPSVAIVPNRNELVVVYGGSDPDQLQEVTFKDFVASVTERKIVASATSVTSFDCPPFAGSTLSCLRGGSDPVYVPYLNFRRFFGFDANLARIGNAPLGERMMGPPVIFSGVAYFTTYTPDLVNACNPGTGKLYGVDFRKPGIGTSDTTDCTTALGRLDADENASTPATTESIVIGSAVPYGVTVVQRPSCAAGVPIGDMGPACQGGTPLADLSPAGPSLVFQTGVKNLISDDTRPAGSNAVPDIGKKTRSVVSLVQSLFVSAWGFVFD